LFALIASASPTNRVDCPQETEIPNRLSVLQANVESVFIIYNHVLLGFIL